MKKGASVYGAANYYNDEYNILRIFDTLSIFLFTKSETKRDYQ